MATKVNGTKQEYAKVVISLENCLLPTEKLIETPSIKDGLSKEVETSLRIVGCEFIQAAGILLKLPQVAMATGQVIFQRFFYCKSFVKHDAEVYAMACIFLAAKIEEAPRRIRDVINVFHYIKQRRNNRTIEAMGLSFSDIGKCDEFLSFVRTIQHMEYMGNTYFNRKNLVVKAERRVLKELGFCVHVKHPHKIIINYLKILECENNQELTKLAWNYMNDSLRTNVFVRFPPETIACACIFLSARKLKICLPNKPHWFELFDATLKDLEEISLTTLELYNQPKVTLDELLKKTTELRAEIEERKKKSTEEKSQTSTNQSSNKPTPSDSRPGSRTTSPSKVSPFSAGEETKRKGSSRAEEDKKSTEIKDRNHTSRQNRRSRSPRNRNHSGTKSRSISRSRSRSRSKSHSRSRSRSRSRSYSLSVSPPDNRPVSDSLSSDAESPEQRRQGDKYRKRRGTTRSSKNRSRQRSRERRPDKKSSKIIYSNRERSYDRRPRARPRSRSPIARSRSRSRSRSPIRDRSKRYHSKHDRERSKSSADYHRNGVDYRTRDRDGGRDHSRRHR